MSNSFASAQSSFCKQGTREYDVDRNEKGICKEIGLITKQIALRMRYIFFYISLPSLPKQQREIAKFKILWRT